MPLSAGARVAPWVFAASVLAARPSRAQSEGESASVPQVQSERCDALDRAAFERLLAIEWRDPTLAELARPVRVLLVCDARSVRVTLRAGEGPAAIERTRALEVSEREWAVVPRIVALVATQLAVTVERERQERAQREEQARLEQAARAQRERAPRPIAPAPAPVERAVDRLWIEGAMAMRARQFDAPWLTGGGSFALSARLGRAPLWLGGWLDCDGSARSFSLGSMGFARVSAGPAVSVASAFDARWFVGARAGVLVGAQSLWAASSQQGVQSGSLLSLSIAARVNVMVGVRLTRAVALSFAMDSAVELVGLAGALDGERDLREVRTDGLSIGGALGLLWRY